MFIAGRFATLEGSLDLIASVQPCHLLSDIDLAKRSLGRDEVLLRMHMEDYLIT